MVGRHVAPWSSTMAQRGDAGWNHNWEPWGRTAKLQVGTGRHGESTRGRARRHDMDGASRGAMVAPRRGSAMVSPTRCYKVGRHVASQGGTAAQQGDPGWHHNGALWGRTAT
ncbi:hypothetical protein GUJ93_ZPchr0011g27772 [Zizania palustris]|uniref:Uncharacterized protein n=1 Tax=Zizania palustris TaxID=103762 RepID=A0A8J5WGA2_ZIZPA|nr:hypothetical protein GUJ93_ZPchr0011g27772 [Zizania palustris]